MALESGNVATIDFYHRERDVITDINHVHTTFEDGSEEDRTTMTTTEGKWHSVSDGEVYRCWEGVHEWLRTPEKEMGMGRGPGRPVSSGTTDSSGQGTMLKDQRARSRKPAWFKVSTPPA